VRVWKIVAYYLAQLCLNITLLVSPEKIVIGGGIMNRVILYGFIQDEFIRMLAGYVDHPLLKKGAVEEYIVAPKLGAEVGVKGAMSLMMM
jgi:fructokinase